MDAGTNSNILFDSTPLYLPKKNSGIKSIEICFDKTNDRRRQDKKVGEKSLIPKLQTSSEEEMFESEESRKTFNNFAEANAEQNVDNLQIQAGIMINAQVAEKLETSLSLWNIF